MLRKNITCKYRVWFQASTGGVLENTPLGYGGLLNMECKLGIAHTENKNVNL